MVRSGCIMEINIAKVKKIKIKIENNMSLTKKEIDFVNDYSVCSVYGFTNCIGNLSLGAK